MTARKAGIPLPQDLLSRMWIEWQLEEKKPMATIRRRAAVLRSVRNAGRATRAEIEAWWETRRDLAAATRNTDLGCLRSFYKWCQKFDHRKDDPSIRLDAPKVGRGMPHPIPQDQLDTYLSATCDMRDPKLYRAGLLMAYTGLRVSEAAAADWGLVDPTPGDAYIEVTGKGDKTRRVPLEDDVLAELGDPGPAGTSIVTGTETAMSGDALDSAVNRALRDIGSKATAHHLRHYFGTQFYRSTRDLAATAAVMGHSNIQTTRGYAAAVDEAARKGAAGVAAGFKRRTNREK
ncbi:MAG TPA: tyrosine-type recombinase/integrase [Nocardioides sp.]